MQKNIFKNKTILITGGTGSFGKSFLNRILTKHTNVKKVIIFSRDELKQYELKNSIEKKKIDKIRFFIGDVEMAQDSNEHYKMLILLYMQQH